MYNKEMKVNMDLENNKLDKIINKLDKLEESLAFTYKIMTYPRLCKKISDYYCCCTKE